LDDRRKLTQQKLTTKLIKNMNKKISYIKTHENQELPTSIKTRRSYNLSQLSSHHSPSAAHVGLKSEFLKPDREKHNRQILMPSPSYGNMN